MRRGLCIAALYLAGCATGPGLGPALQPAAAPAITLGRLFDELSDPALLARRANPTYTSLLASSFDPSSRAATPEEPAWFANKDFARPVPGEAFTVLDVVGPGVITRIWSANPSGVVRVYLDGASEPAIEAELRALLTGEVSPFGAPFAFEVAGGKNLYFPIAFARGCKVTIESDAKRLYYQLDYRRYAADVRVETYSPAAIERAATERARAEVRLHAAASGAQSPMPATATFSLPVEGGQTAEARIDASNGGSAIRELRIRPSRTDAEALRGTILRLTFDGETTVQVPLGDFFGTGPGLAPVRSLTSTVDASGVLTARWTMPFRTHATIALTGTLASTFEVSVEVATEPFRWDDDALYFGAHWHAPGWHQSEPERDWPMFELHGAGTYVGTLLNLINGNPQWWGEGDEKIYVDGEAFPSHFGTGTEDYFGFAYCSNGVFTAPHVGQTRVDARQNWGTVSLYRVHTLDAIPFERDLRFDFEIHHWGDQAVLLELDAIGFFYARPGVRVEPVASEPAQYRVPELRTPPPSDVAPTEYVCGSG